MNPAKILKAWMQKYGPLSEEMQQRFLDRDETQQLAALPERAVYEGLRHGKQLKVILGEARAAAGGWEPPPRRWKGPRDTIYRPGRPEERPHS